MPRVPAPPRFCPEVSFAFGSVHVSSFSFCPHSEGLAVPMPGPEVTDHSFNALPKSAGFQSCEKGHKAFY